MIEPIYISGPHGAGKTTLIERLSSRKNILVLPRSRKPDLLTQSAKERALQNAALYCSEIHFHRQIFSPTQTKLGDHCIVDTLIYTHSYFKLGWINRQERSDILEYVHGNRPRSRYPKFIFFLVPSQHALNRRIKLRAEHGDQRWRERDCNFLEALVSSYPAFFEDHSNLFRNGWVLVKECNFDRVVEQLESFIDQSTLNWTAK